MKKLTFIIIFLLFMTSCNSISSNSFYNIIKDYPHNSKKLTEYEQAYIETGNIIYAINKVNYPNFLIPNSTNYLAFKQNNIFFVNTNYKLSKTYVPKTLVKIENVDCIKRDNQEMMLDKETLDAYTRLFNESLVNNLHLIIFSAYRSYEYQKNNKKK